ncbi:integrase [Mycolicibacterium elephantis]|uniref:tyrosine-type recombinase/integrase n=1 Tax=Mycolicibacterium elephantis TaxID=81858 RepID=UPI0007EAD640|nr:tyrosine-type recombinase/integrase [Mycolicibacterium elephantis]OBA71680.1 integrase [Mycolicibacterium elephantis]
MARIQKRTRANGKPVYIVKWRTPDGRDRSKGGFATRKEASDYGTRAEGSKLRGVEFDPKSGEVLFRQAAQDWLKSRADLKVTTHGGYRAMFAPAEKRRGDGKVLGIDPVFGGWPVNRITREYIQEWVQRMIDAGKKPSTVRHAFFAVRMVLAQAVADGRLAANPAEYVKIPTESGRHGGKPGVVDDPSQFLTAAQVAALVGATPWPYNVLVHVAAWSGLRAAELGGLQVGDVELPEVNLNPSVPSKPGVLRVERTARIVGTEMTYLAPKTKGSRRRVPLTADTTAMLRDYLALHPRRNEPDAPLFPHFALVAQRPTGKRALDADGKPVDRAHKAKALRNASALAGLSVEEAEARLTLDWSRMLQHGGWYKAVYGPAVLRANRMFSTATLPPALRFHSLRHTYASLCVAAGIPPLEISRFMGHANVGITLGVYTHLFEDDHSDSMAALGAMGRRAVALEGNVIPLRG